MKFLDTDLDGVVEIELEPIFDERGFFARSWCEKEFQTQRLHSQFVQCNVSYNPLEGTLRGMHYQAEPFPEVKIVRCTRGAIYDVVLDLRPESRTFRHWFGVRLAETDLRMIYVPPGCAHGFLTLEDRTEVFYQMSEFYHPELARGVRWDDPAFNVAWPAAVRVISERDKSFPDFGS